jgi:hypothetical protein
MPRGRVVSAGRHGQRMASRWSSIIEIGFSSALNEVKTSDRMQSVKSVGNDLPLVDPWIWFWGRSFSIRNPKDRILFYFAKLIVALPSVRLSCSSRSGGEDFLTGVEIGFTEMIL